MHQIRFPLGPRWGAYSAPPDPLSGGPTSKRSEGNRGEGKGGDGGERMEGREKGGKGGKEREGGNWEGEGGKSRKGRVRVAFPQIKMYDHTPASDH